MPTRRSLILTLSLAITLLALGSAHAQSSGWLAPVEVSQPPLGLDITPQPDERRYGSSWFADLALGPEGSAHIIWYSGIGLGGEGANSLDLLLYRELHNGEWSPINEIVAPATGGYTVRNSIAQGRDGRLHAIFRGETKLYYMSAPWEDAFSALAWSEPRILADGSVYYNALAADNAGTLHAFWSEAVVDDPLTPNTICPNCSDLFYRRSLDGGQSWEPAVNLSQSAEGDNRPQVRVDARNRLHLVWDEGVDWYAGNGLPKAGVYRRSDDGGQSWGDPVRFALPPAAVSAIERQRAEEDAERNPTPRPPTSTPEADAPRAYIDAVQQTALAVDGDGNPAVVFRGVGNDQLYFQRSDDGGVTWGEPQAIPGVLGRDLRDNNLDIYALAADSQSRLHLLMVGFDAASYNPFEPTNPSLLYLSFDGTRWSAPAPVVTNDLYPEYPKLQVYNGNQLHAVWFTRSRDDLFDSERARYRVWYSARELSAPAQSALPLFTPVPTAGPTASPAPPTATPAPTPLPASVLAAPPIDGPMNWERSGLSTIILAMLPAIGIISLVLALRLYIARRRG